MKNLLRFALLLSLLAGCAPAQSIDATPTVLPTNTTQPTLPPTPEPQKVVFASNQEGNWNLYLSYLGGDNEVALTNDPGDERNPVWSPDGKWIAYESKQGDTWQISLIDAHGGNGKNLTEAGNNQDPSWSPDGTKIVFDSDRDGETYIYLMDANGENEARISAPYHPRENEPAWSPDGSTIAFIGANDTNYPTCGDECTESVSWMNTKGEAYEYVDEPGWYHSLGWSVDGGRLIYIHSYYEYSEIEVYDLDQHQVSPLDIRKLWNTIDSRPLLYLYFTSLSISPDGQNFALCSTAVRAEPNATSQQDSMVYVEGCYLVDMADASMTAITKGTEYVGPQDANKYSIRDARLQP